MENPFEKSLGRPYGLEVKVLRLLLDGQSPPLEIIRTFYVG